MPSFSFKKKSVEQIEKNAKAAIANADKILTEGSIKSKTKKRSRFFRLKKGAKTKGTKKPFGFLSKLKTKKMKGGQRKTMKKRKY